MPAHAVALRAVRALAADRVALWSRAGGAAHRRARGHGDEFDPARRTGTGFLFDALEPDALLDAVRRAAAAFARPELWGALVRNAMTEDFSWDASAREYAALYRKILRPQAARPSRRSR